MSTNAILLKLQPNQDVTLALEDAVRAAGLGRARIWAAVGSLIEGVIQRPDGIERIAGPAIEVAALSGEVSADGDAAQLYGYFCCDDTRVVQGPLVRGLNIVAVTFEVLMEDADGQ